MINLPGQTTWGQGRRKKKKKSNNRDLAKKRGVKRNDEPSWETRSSEKTFYEPKVPASHDQKGGYVFFSIVEEGRQQNLPISGGRRHISRKRGGDAIKKPVTKKKKRLGGRRGGRRILSGGHLHYGGGEAVDECMNY